MNIPKSEVVLSDAVHQVVEAATVTLGMLKIEGDTERFRIFFGASALDVLAEWSKAMRRENLALRKRNASLERQRLTDRAMERKSK